MKVFLISHRSDPDGITPLILSKLIFDTVDSLLVEACSVNDETLNLINNNAFDTYDAVYITDLGLNKTLLDIINGNDNLKSKIKIFDHHAGNMIGNDYDFAKIVDVDDNDVKQSGTSLYYDFLLSSYNFEVLNKRGLKEFVNMVREYDTWEWVKTNNQDAKKLAHLFDLYGREYFAEHYINFFKENDDFYFDDKELFLLDIEQRNIDNYISEKKEDVIPVTLLGHKSGLVFATKYRSELGNALAKSFSDVYDFIVIINIEHGISYRGVKDVDLNQVANAFGGKGHTNSSGSPLPHNIQETLAKMIFKDKIEVSDSSVIKTDCHL